MDNKLKIIGDSVILSINPKLYHLEVIYSASYVFLDKAYVFLDGDPEKEILVTLKPKENIDLEKLGGEFFNELVNYADYRTRAKQTQKIREVLLQRALFTNDPIKQTSPEFDDLIKGLEDDKFDDTDDIAIPWDEKYKREDETENKDKIKQ
ncbi:His-Xaa-Ser system protein HxsD [Candidatus Woesearchaeota archaeon]|nr:His-Xaa-Ser system protein HxsD [Candidatus Woesearchaeota archaeon]|tara:strand:- start:3043 stop:3495 length:453 start_codon:yes stop_codon:yes gene_type:complete